MPNTIAENLQRLVAAKSAIANAITAKGGTVTVGDGLEDFATDIGTISSGSGITQFSLSINDNSVGWGFYDGTTLVLCALLYYAGSSLRLTFPHELSYYGFDPSSPVEGTYACSGAYEFKTYSLSGSSTYISPSKIGSTTWVGFCGYWIG